MIFIRFGCSHQTLLAALIGLVVVVVDGEMKSELDFMFFDPCTFPDFADALRCGIYDATLQRHKFVCDPFGTMSVSELRLLENTLDAVRHSKQSHCVCAVGKCSYRYGFAFLNKLEPLANRSVETFSKDYCPRVRSQTAYPTSVSSDEVLAFAQNYARLIRERNFQMGLCQEEILVLVIRQLPDTKFRQASIDEYRTDYFYKPRIFVSYGPLVLQRFSVNNPYTGTFVPIDSLQKIVNDENMRLQNGFPIIQVLRSFVTRTDDELRLVSQSQQMPQIKRHVPNWAWIIFGVCGLLFALMAVGLYLLRSRTRRSTFRGKSNMDQRKWKAGFVGEENQPTTYANLMSQMMLKTQPALSSTTEQSCAWSNPKLFDWH